MGRGSGVNSQTKEENGLVMSMDNNFCQCVILYKGYVSILIQKGSHPLFMAGNLRQNYQH